MSPRADIFIEEVAGLMEDDKSLPYLDTIEEDIQELEAYEDDLDFNAFMEELESIDLDEGLDVKPLGFKGNLYYIDISGVQYGYKLDNPDDAEKFEKMVKFGTGFKALNWLKKRAKRVVKSQKAA